MNTPQAFDEVSDVPTDCFLLALLQNQEEETLAIGEVCLQRTEVRGTPLQHGTFWARKWNRDAVPQDRATSLLFQDGKSITVQDWERCEKGSSQHFAFGWR